MTQDDLELPEPKSLRFLRRLVTLLLISLIFGTLTITALFVWKFQNVNFSGLSKLPELPAALAEEDIQSVTYAQNHLIVLVKGDGGQKLQLYDKKGGLLHEYQLSN